MQKGWAPIRRANAAKLREELRRLQAALTAKEQEMMEMRSTR
jgi:uncharacterized protein YlxW (UPF0749 family)